MTQINVTSGDTAGQRLSWDVSKVTGVYCPPGKAGGRGQVGGGRPFPIGDGT